jgi:hypothetical protein
MNIQQGHADLHLKDMQHDMGMQHEHTAGKCSNDKQHGITACVCSMYM